MCVPVQSQELHTLAQQSLPAWTPSTDSSAPAPPCPCSRDTSRRRRSETADQHGDGGKTSWYAVCGKTSWYAACGKTSVCVSDGPTLASCAHEYKQAKQSSRKALKGEAYSHESKPRPATRDGLKPPQQKQTGDNSAPQPTAKTKPMHSSPSGSKSSDEAAFHTVVCQTATACGRPEQEAHQLCDLLLAFGVGSLEQLKTATTDAWNEVPFVMRKPLKVRCGLLAPPDLPTTPPSPSSQPSVAPLELDESIVVLVLAQGRDRGWAERDPVQLAEALISFALGNENIPLEAVVVCCASIANTKDNTVAARQFIAGCNRYVATGEIGARCISDLLWLRPPSNSHFPLEKVGTLTLAG